MAKMTAVAAASPESIRWRVSWFRAICS